MPNTKLVEIGLVVLILLGGLRLGAQDVDSLQRANRRLMWNDFFFGQATNGINAGIINAYLLDSYAVGAEIKQYSSFWGPFGSSFHGNYRYIINAADGSLPSSVLTAGVHYLFLGLDTNLYFGNDAKGWYLTPKAGIDKGFLGIFYGYSVPLQEDEFTNNRHVVELKYHLNFEAFKDYKRRIELGN